MTKDNASFEALKSILTNIRNPGLLDDHPWTQSLIVQDALSRDANLLDKSPGQQLISAIMDLFSQMMPAIPPKRGIRLDTHWGEFGLLAAMYFAPLKFGAPQPTSLRDTWGRIDQAILLFAHAESSHLLSEKGIARYRLVIDEPETGPASTLSDWHRRGIERLAEVIAKEEQRLRSQKNTLEARTREDKPKGSKVRTGWLWFRWALLLAVVSLLAVGGWQAWKVYQRVQSVRQHVQALQAFSISSLNVEQATSAGQHLSAMRTDMSALQKEAAPFLSLAPYLGWLPTYGGDLTQASALVEMGVQLSITGDESFQAVAPILPDVMEDRNSVSVPELLNTLINADTQLLTAQVALSRARAARQQVDTELLSERTRTLLQDKVDPFLLVMQGAFPVDDVLRMARLAPRLLGAVENGPQTYLILIQNEDELRPTGGFITAVGQMAVEDGQLTHLAFEGVSMLDDFSKPYPAAPWQLDEYMRSEILILRDANWFTNFPTTVEWTEFLYAYTRSAAIDGVIAVDQHVVVEILREIGPIEVEGEVEGKDELITAENVMEYMRTARRETPPAGVDGTTWDRKQFINRMAGAMTQKILTRRGYSLEALLRTMMRLLDEKHILLQVDDPEMKELLAKRGWDGAVRPASNSDFLMAVDTNVGFNKTNLVVDESLVYELDLRDLARPLAHLGVTHTNHAQVEITCYQIPATVGIVIEQEYPFNDCYWNYLRVYTPGGSELSGSTPHAIPAGRTLRETAVPARVDVLGDENNPGTAVYGTLMVVPPGESLQTGFDLRLPQSVLEQDPQSLTWTYRLTVQKQPGTLAVPFSLRLLLPPGTQVSSSSHELQREKEAWLLETDLRKDLEFFMVLATTD